MLQVEGDNIDKLLSQKLINDDNYDKKELISILKELFKAQDYEFKTVSTNELEIALESIPAMIIIDEDNIDKNINPTMLRHSFAIHLLNEGANIVVVSKILGNSNLSSLQSYLDYVNKNIRQRTVPCLLMCTDINKKVVLYKFK